MTTRLLIIVLILTISCDGHKGSFHFRYNENQIDEVNTFDKVFSRKYQTREQRIEFQLSDGEQKAIDAFAESIQIDKISQLTDQDTCNNGEMMISLPSDEYELEFGFSKRSRKTLKWGNNNCDDPTVKKVQEFADSLKRMILRKNEFKDIEQTDIMRL